MTLLAAAARAQCIPQWVAIPNGANSAVRAMTTWDPDGAGPLAPRLVIGGEFSSVGGVSANGIAAWDGQAWAPLGTGVSSPGVSGTVYALLAAPNGDLIAGGSFTLAGGVAANNVARWNGSAWSPLGSGTAAGFLGATVWALAALPNGDVIAGGDFSSAGGVSARSIARWNGSTWSGLGSGMNYLFGGNSVKALVTMPNGDLVAGGFFTSAGGASASCIARWNGSAWSALGAGFGSVVRCLVARPDGTLIAGGDFTQTAGGGLSANRVASWSGSSWSALQAGVTGAVYTTTLLPNGDLVVGGDASPGVPAFVARWDGMAWSQFGVGVPTLAPSCMAFQEDGSLLVGGAFTSLSSTGATARIARVVSPCPATATTTATGCSSSGGLNTLTAINRPWAGSTFRAEGTGMPLFAFICTVTGFSTISLPLSSVLAQGQPGCNLAVSPDVLNSVLATTGTATAVTALPNTPSLAGIVFHQQMIALEVDPSLNFTAITATNALAMTVGFF